MKRTLALILALVMIVGMIPMSVFADETTPTLKFTHDVTDVSALKAGDKFTVTATLTNNPGFASFQFDLDWDNTVVQFDGFGMYEGRYGLEFDSEVTLPNEYDNQSGTIVIGVSDNITRNGYLFKANFTVLKEGDADITFKKEWPSYEMKQADESPVTVTFDESALAELTITHTHNFNHSVEVTAPTCTAGGYTTYTCTCGDSYTGDTTPATGHTNVNGTCSVCGAALTVIPEGAPFLEIVTADGKNVTVTDMGMEPNYQMGTLYKVEVPLGTTQVNITYNQGDVFVDQFGYASVIVVNDPNVSQDGYGQTTKEGKTIVGLQMEKAAANGFGTLKLLNIPYPSDPYELRAVGLMKDYYEDMHFFAFTYALEEGQHFAVLPEGVGYTVSGNAIASNGYKFNVAIDEGFEDTEDFAVKVNGETIATQPGEVTVSSVTEDLYITVEGVAKIADPDNDIILTVDLTGYTGEIEGSIWYSDNEYNNVEIPLTAGKKNTLALTASKSQSFFASIYSISPLVVGYDVNGTVYAIPNSYTGHDLGNGYKVNLNNDGYMQLGTNGTNPGTFVIKPVLGTSESVGAAPAFVENCIKVTDISVVGADVIRSAWEGDTLNVILAEDTALDAPLKTMWTIYANNTKEGASQPCFNINGRLQTPSGTEATFTWVESMTLEDGTATKTAAFAVADMPWNPESALEFTPKTFTINFYVSGKEPAPTYTVNIDENITGGTVTANPASAAEGAAVTLTQASKAGYEFVEFTVTDAEGNAVTVNETIEGEDITYTFTMPAGNVTVSAEYLELPNTITEYDVSHPLMEEKTVEIDGETHENINVMSLFKGFAEKLIEVIETLVEDKISAQHLKFTSSNEDVAKIEDGKVIPVGPGIALITVEPADNEAAAATFALLRDNNAQQFAVEVTEVPAGYTVVMPADTDPNLGDVISVEVTVGSDNENAPVNAYDMTFTYDPAKLELVSQNTDSTNTETYLEGLHVGGEIPAGTIHMERYGQNQTAGDVAFTLKFKVLEAGNAAIQVTSAKVGTSQEALESDASVATLADPVTQIISSYGIKLPAGFDGASSVAPNTNYTFTAQDVHYDYTFKVTVGGTVVENAVVDNEDGTFTIAKDKINGNVQIELAGDPVGKTYDVDLTGAADITGAETAQYMAADGYTATLTPVAGCYYKDFAVTIGGNEYTGYTEQTNDETGVITYTIPGKDITGNIVITHTKSELAENEVRVNFTGNGAGDRAEDTQDKATIGGAYSFTLNKKPGFYYTVTYKMGDDTEFTTMPETENRFTIESVTGEITINIEKVNDLEVQITNYIDLDGKTMFLVTATQTLEEGKALAYDNTPMFQKTYTYVTETPEGTTTEEKTEWVYLVMVDKAAEGAEPVVFDAAAAKAKITDITATTTVLGKTFNVNESGIGDGDSVGTVDINDAQLVYDMYMKLYDTLDATMMRKFLKADVNGSKSVDTMDAAAIVDEIISKK